MGDEEQPIVSERERLIQTIQLKEQARGMEGRFLQSKIADAGSLQTTITETPGLWGYKDGVVVGNTGLFFINDDGIIFEHFLPDASNVAIEGNDLRFIGAF